MTCNPMLSLPITKMSHYSTLSCLYNTGINHRNVLSTCLWYKKFLRWVLKVFSKLRVLSAFWSASLTASQLLVVSDEYSTWNAQIFLFTHGAFKIRKKEQCLFLILFKIFIAISSFLSWLNCWHWGNHVEYKIHQCSRHQNLSSFLSSLSLFSSYFSFKIETFKTLSLLAVHLKAIHQKQSNVSRKNITFYFTCACQPTVIF